MGMSLISGVKKWRKPVDVAAKLNLLTSAEFRLVLLGVQVYFFALASVQRPCYTGFMSIHFSSTTDKWSTPQPLFDVLHAEFHFTLDVCALPSNAKCTDFYTPEDDGLKQPWIGLCWMNPPYGREIVHWMERAFVAPVWDGVTVVCLVPARIDTRWWWDYARHGEVRLLKGRLKFGGHENSAPFPSAVVIFRAPQRASTTYWEWAKKSTT